MNFFCLFSRLGGSVAQLAAGFEGSVWRSGRTSGWAKVRDPAGGLRLGQRQLPGDRPFCGGISMSTENIGCPLLASREHLVGDGPGR